jgi:acetyl-CoA acetyltransferase
MTEEQVLAGAMVNPPLTQFMFCSPGEGAVALLVASAERARRMQADGVRLRAVEFRSRRFGSFEVYSPWLSPERAEGPSSEAARAAFASAGIGPEEVQVAQLQDTESGAEIMHLAETGLCADGDQEQWYADGVTEIVDRTAQGGLGGLFITTATRGETPAT